eukprot:747383-Hanusia_phi.AAC.2
MRRSEKGLGGRGGGREESEGERRMDSRRKVESRTKATCVVMIVHKPLYPLTLIAGVLHGNKFSDMIPRLQMSIFASRLHFKFASFTAITHRSTTPTSMILCRMFSMRNLPVRLGLECSRRTAPGAQHGNIILYQSMSRSRFNSNFGRRHMRSVPHISIPRVDPFRSDRPPHSNRYQEEVRKRQQAKNRQLAMYMGGVTLFTISFTYLSVPLYRLFCAKTGFAGTVKPADMVDYESKAKPISGKRILKIKFNADTSDSMPWKFIPQQYEIKVLPGEAALAFYTAENRTDKAIIGVASYNIQPEGAALYFNKIQCFCFEEQVGGYACSRIKSYTTQMLKPNEKIDMPVFFFIDPDFLNDKNMSAVDTITLSYTFFKAGDSDAPEVAGMLQQHAPRYQKQAA